MQGPLIIIDLWTISPSNFEGVVSPSSKRGRLKRTRTKVVRIDSKKRNFLEDLMWDRPEHKNKNKAEHSWHKALMMTWPIGVDHFPMQCLPFNFLVIVICFIDQLVLIAK